MTACDYSRIVDWMTRYVRMFQGDLGWYGDLSDSEKQRRMSSTPSAMIQIGLRQSDQALFSVIKGPCMCSVTLLDDM